MSPRLFESFGGSDPPVEAITEVRRKEALLKTGALQDAIFKAGKEAGDYGRKLESSEEVTKLDTLEKAGKLKRVAFTDRPQMKKLVDPVIEAYAREIGADQILAKINAIK